MQLYFESRIVPMIGESWHCLRPLEYQSLWMHVKRRETDDSLWFTMFAGQFLGFHDFGASIVDMRSAAGVVAWQRVTWGSADMLGTRVERVALVAFPREATIEVIETLATDRCAYC